MTTWHIGYEVRDRHWAEDLIRAIAFARDGDTVLCSVPWQIDIAILLNHDLRAGPKKLDIRTRRRGDL